MTELAKPKTLQRLAILMGERGVDRPGKLRLAEDHARRRLRSTGELTEDEAQELIRRLRDLDAHDLAATLRRLTEEDARG
jgi:uncharacterized protein YktB (UPF0637 family)